MFLKASVALIRRFIDRPAAVPVREVLEALADPSRAVDRVLERYHLDWWSSAEEALREAYPSHGDLTVRIPPRRWLKIVHPADLWPSEVGAVPSEVSAAFAAWLRSFAWEMHGSAMMVAWAERRDIFDDAGAIAFVRMGVEEAGDNVLEFAGFFLGRGEVEEGMELLRGMPAEAIEEIIATVDTSRLVRWLREHEDRVESDGFEHGDLLAVIRVLTRSQDLEALQACLAAIERNLDDDLASDLLCKLATAFGLVIEGPFRERRPWDRGHYDPAFETMRLVLDELAKVPRLRAVLVGDVGTRPKMLNGVGTGWRPCGIPVVLDGQIVGRALRVRYPDPSNRRAEFEVEVDGTAVPGDWWGRAVSFERVDQGRSWPGPPPIRVVVSRGAPLGERRLLGREA